MAHLPGYASCRRPEVDVLACFLRVKVAGGTWTHRPRLIALTSDKCYFFQYISVYVRKFVNKYPMPTALPATVPPLFPPQCLQRRLGNNIHVFYISMRLVLCLPKHTPKSKKYRAERPPFCCLVWSQREYPYSVPIWTNFSNLSGQNAPKIHPGRPSRAFSGQSGGGGAKECNFC